MGDTGRNQPEVRDRGMPGGAHQSMNWRGRTAFPRAECDETPFSMRNRGLHSSIEDVS
jgi:hypothetical protein